jgi:hypothetical protein
MAIDTNKNFYYGATDGRLYKRSFNDTSTCLYLGSFGTYINALVADVGGNIYAAGSDFLYKYESTTHLFKKLGDFPLNYNSMGDLFFYEAPIILFD